MPKIKRIYLISNTHTDIGYTDHQDTVFRQHLGFIDRAIELGEATADYPEEARYKWTCEVTSFVERYFQQRPAKPDRPLPGIAPARPDGGRRHAISLDAAALDRRDAAFVDARCAPAARLRLGNRYSHAM